jgi:hypothetical protein
LAEDLREPHLNVADQTEVGKMISCSLEGVNQTDGINFNKIVMDAAVLREYFRCKIPKEKVLLDKNGGLLKNKADTPEASTLGGASKATKKRTNVLEASALGDAPKMASK